MVLLFDRLLFKSYNDKMYKITDTKTNVYIYNEKSVFNKVMEIRIDKDKYLVVHKNNKPTEFHESILPMTIEILISKPREHELLMVDYTPLDIKIHSYDELMKLYDKYDVYYLIIFNDEYMNLKKIPSSIKKYIHSLSKDIEKKCKDISIQFDYSYKLTDMAFTSFVLCLFYKEMCISTIYYIIEDDNIVKMDLYTLDKHQGKQYMLFLCSIAIMISKHYHLTKIYLDAQNPITVHMFLKYFNCEYDKSFKKLLGDRKITMEICNEYFKNKSNKPWYKTMIKTLDIFVPINDENLEKAKKLYEDLLEKDSKLKCP